VLEAAAVSVRKRRQPLAALLRRGLGESVDPGRLIEYLEPLEVEAEGELIRQGDSSDDLYFLEAGRLTAQFVSPDGEAVRIQTMGPGTVVGEVSLYGGTARTASVVSETPSKLHRLTRASLEEMERRDPELAAALHRQFARLLATRLADAQQTVRALLE
jgi:sulfate permease, SulP family